MPLTASQLLDQRLGQEKQSIQTAFQNEWSIVNRRFGPQRGDPRVEAARQRALSGLHQKYAARADALLGQHEKQLASLSEIDTMAESGMLRGANPEELKLRAILPEGVERAAFPKEEDQPDPMAEYGRFDVQRGRVRSELERFQFEDPKTQRAPVGRVFKRGSIETQGGGVQVIEQVYDDEKGQRVRRTRPASREEIRQWAELTEEERRLTGAMQGIMRSDPMAARIRLAMARSKRGLDTDPFAEKATGSSTPKQTVKRLTSDIAVKLYEEAGGDAAKARELARQRGYEF